MKTIWLFEIRACYCYIIVVGRHAKFNSLGPGGVYMCVSLKYIFIGSGNGLAPKSR